MTEERGATETLEREVNITRVFDAPRALVWAAWTEPEHLARWWGPKDFANPVCEVDLRPGGSLYIVMRAPDGTDHPMRGVFQEIVEPERLAFTSNALDADGTTVLEGRTEVTFAETGGKTRVMLRSRARGLVPDAATMLAGMEEGWTQSLECLREHLASVR